MANFKRAVAMAAAALLVSTVVSARATRTVILLNFSQSQLPAPVAAESAQTPLDVNALSRVMTRPFTGAPEDGSAMDMWFQTSPSRGANNLVTLGNPFVRHAVYEPIRAPAVAGPRAADCLMPAYQPSGGFGRLAEQRRRVIFPLVHRAACEAGVPVGLFDALVMQESRYKPDAISPKGAVGLAQLMPATAHQLGVDRYSLLENLRGGARYLKQHVDQFGRYDLALAAYNAGPHRQSLREGRIPNISETQDYVRNILANWSGAPAPVASVPRPLSFRQAQMIFMAYRGANY